MFRSLIARVVFAFTAALALVILLFIAANQYAIERQRRQAVQAQAMLLELYATQMESELESQRLGLLQQVAGDLDLNGLCIYDPNSNRYKLAAQACKKRLGEDLQTSEWISTRFLYDEETGVLLTASDAFASSRHLYMQGNIRSFLRGADGARSHVWTRVFSSGYINEGEAQSWLLVKSARVADRLTLGVILPVENLIPPLEEAIAYSGAITQVYAEDGALLAQSTPRREEDAQRNAHIAAHFLQSEEPLRIVDAADGESYIAISRAVDAAEVRIVSLLPEHAVLQQLEQFERIGTCLPLALLAMLLACAAVIPALYRPFGQLVDIMEGVAKGDLSLRLPPGRTPEFRRVNERFNQMVEQIARLNQDVREQTERTHKAELLHLQAQINPHFYQNALNLIYNLAALKQFALIQEVALHLAGYFRFIMRSGDRAIRLREELEHIENYMEIQKIRYPNAMDYVCSVEAGLEDFPILPLCVQPFVENSVIHGFTARRRFCVCVRAVRRGEDYVEITVEDNGIGMTTPLTQTLNRCMAAPDGQPSAHLGVWNVATRLQKHYGTRAALWYETGRSVGVCIHLLLPAREKAQDNGAR